MLADDSLMSLYVGQTAHYSRFVSDADVALFALVTGDEHPLHLDRNYAATTRFAQRIVPTTLINGIIEAAFAKTIPGIQGLFAHQSMSFPAPAFVDDEVTVAITITQVNFAAQQISCHVIASRSDGTTTVSGDTDFALEDLPPFTGDTDE